MVQATLRNASFAVGPAARPDDLARDGPGAAQQAIVTAIFLSVARIAGETAPLLRSRRGSTTSGRTSLNEFTPTLPPYIWKYATAASANWNRQSLGRLSSC